MVAGVFIVVALSEELEDKKAALPARNGSSAVAGFAVDRLLALEHMELLLRRRRTSQGH
jgi:hypothetical protein